MIQKKIGLICLLLISMAINKGLTQQAQSPSKANAAIAELDSTIWKYLAATDRSQWTITKTDSENALRNYFIPGATIFKTSNEIWEKVVKKTVPIEQEAANLINLLEQVRDYFEEGLKINPFDNYLRTGITTTYSRLENLYLFQKEPIKRLQMLYNLLYLKKDPRDRLYYYQNIGMIYRQMERWEPARDYYHLAVTAIFESDESAIDTTRLFENLYWRGYAQFRLYEDEPARTSFAYARMIAPDENWYNQLTAYLNFIDWDGGNIRASEKYNEARRLNNEKKYDEAEIAFLELLGMVTTEKATNEAQLALAKMQFNFLNKKDEAMDRLWNVVSKYPLDPASGIPVDTTYQELWDNYAQLCLRMGVDCFSTNKKSSFAYFLKTSQIAGSWRGQAFLNLAMASMKNPHLCISYCTRALDYEGQLGPDQKKLLYQTIYQAYLQQGDFEQALQWFKKLYRMSS